MNLTLEVTKREGKNTDPDVVPGVVYGPKQESIALAMPKRAFETILKEAGESTIITLTGAGEDIEVLVHDVAYNPEKGGVHHVDFYAIERGKALTTNVALSFVGEAPAEKQEGVLNKVLQEVTVTCLPRHLPSEIEVDVSVLVDFDTVIRVKDLPVSDDVKIEQDPEEAVALVAPVKEEVEEEPEVDAADVPTTAEAVAEAGEKSEEAPTE